MERKKKEWECPQCEDELIIEADYSNQIHVPKCLVCGMELRERQDRATNTSSNMRSLFRFPHPTAQSGNQRTMEAGDAFASLDSGLQSLQQLNPDILMDLIHPDLRELFEQLVQEESPNKVVNQKHLEEIGHLLVDERKTVLWDVSLTVGPAHCLLVLADFSAIPKENTEIDSEIILGNPLHGETLPIEDLNGLQGKCVLLERGKIPFIQKYQTYSLQPLSALLISQTKGFKFPFIMTDQHRELQNFPTAAVNEEKFTRFPVGMLSDHDSALIKKILETEQKSTSTRVALPCKIKVSSPVQDCPICVESFESGQEIYKLLCRHVYHRHCLSRWVQSHPHCPLCRQPIQKKAEKEEDRTGSASTREERFAIPGMARDFYR